MNYERIYHNIINNRLNNPISSEYTECHHILPKSLGGNDDKSNLVNLLAREHFICHLLLIKIYKEGSVEWIKMIKAFQFMYSHSPDHQRYSDNKCYEYLKINFSKAQSLNQSGENNSGYGTCWICNYKLNKTIKIKKNELQDYLDKGWIKRKQRKPKYNKERTDQKLINNNIKQKFVFKDELQDYLDKGWKLGGIKGIKSGIPKSFRTKEHCKKLRESNLGKHNKNNT